MRVPLLPFLLVIALLSGACAFAQQTGSQPIYKSNSLTFTSGSNVTRIEVWDRNIIHVIHRVKGAPPEPKSFAVIGHPVPTTLTHSRDLLTLKTSDLQVESDTSTGAVRFLDKSGNVILAEAAGSTALSATTAGGAPTYSTHQGFNLDPTEAIYGLGQHRDGFMNYVGNSVHLQQQNMEVAIPVLLSSKGYAVFWDNPAITDVDAGKSDKSLLTWSSEAGSAVDYYFMYGPEPDKAIAAYRQLTGAAPMLARWGWGFWQCKQRYHSQKQLLDTVAQYRKMQIPIDGIIQDWLYWYPTPWGSHVIDPIRYPDPAGMIKQLHAENTHILFSVWAKFDEGTANQKALQADGDLYSEVMKYVYPPGLGQWYDPFKTSARTLYWKQISTELFKDGIDGWWLDASEPELSGSWGEFRNFKTAAGPGAQVFNAYPLMHTTAVYKGQRADTSDKRVFILTRSAYTGQQRNSAVTWSGDIQGTWKSLAAQIPAGLNFSMSGIPYWNTDTGGFYSKFASNPGYPELFTRWFQFSTFCPMLRVHGNATWDPIEPTKKDHPGKEMWQFPDDTQKALIAFDQLRYHLIPYIYSVSWMVTHSSYTMMRGLVMDFQNDPKGYNISDQYLFGPSIMACPVTQEGAQTRQVYLPAGTQWIDFWTGETLQGGQTITAPAPINQMPLYVRAGSIIPYGPEIQYAQAKSDPIELRVYTGADGSFTLYEDEGDNYNYEHGAYSTIMFNWDDETQRLTVGARKGKFPGMLKNRTFNVVYVGSGDGVGIPNSPSGKYEINYTGEAITVGRIVSKANAN
jgi:alpha-D-xyloside xylohydrolase